jgi:tetratricopeptide (TPR) repeat protein
MGRDAAEALVRSLGGIPAPAVTSRTDLLVIGMRGWPLREDGRVSARLEKARRARSKGWRVRVVPESEFLRLAGRAAPGDPGPRPFTLEQAAHASGAAEAEIRRWELAGLVTARDGLYDFQDLVSLRTIAALRRRGVPLRTIQDSLRQLAEVLPGANRPLAQVQLLDAEGGELLAQVGDSLVLASGQHVMDFAGLTRADDAADRAEDPAGLSVERAARRSDQPYAFAAPGIAEADTSWEVALDRGLELEEEGRHADAAEAYRQAIALRPFAATAYYNLANALASAGRREAAEEMYRLALAIDPGLEIAWYNLAGVLDAGGRREEAAAALRRAVGASPAFGDARFNLAACLHDLGRPAEAAEHWREYLALDPSSEWSKIARRLSGGH